MLLCIDHISCDEIMLSINTKFNLNSKFILIYSPLNNLFIHRGVFRMSENGGLWTFFSL